MNKQKCNTAGTVFVLVQGLVAALFPRSSSRFVKKMIGMNFENAAELKPKPAYVRQLRAIGVGMVAAAGTDLLLQSVENTDDDESQTDEDTE
ncbi:MAG: hypothetical protein RI560_01550 [Natronomonas sp.]|jgi:uncharacterized protein YjeT (DUF2065 family)|uniref:hypothetical protein n=1 Tax=Natronomonas sp. TaxID=2184060 RepID=UPI0028703F4E|nr:hypothetical protein [Natronomonas sp.]MDR9380345.1 hypothetical protein [Natronomonas sp.]MDR9432070.1 hypothetical protein [Natronomonas sp.]